MRRPHTHCHTMRHTYTHTKQERRVKLSGALTDRIRFHQNINVLPFSHMGRLTANGVTAKAALTGTAATAWSQSLLAELYASPLGKQKKALASDPAGGTMREREKGLIESLGKLFRETSGQEYQAVRAS